MVCMDIPLVFSVVLHTLELNFCCDLEDHLPNSARKIMGCLYCCQCMEFTAVVFHARL